MTTRDPGHLRFLRPHLFVKVSSLQRERSGSGRPEDLTLLSETCQTSYTGVGDSRTGLTRFSYVPVPREGPRSRPRSDRHCRRHRPLPPDPRQRRFLQSLHPRPPSHLFIIILPLKSPSLCPSGSEGRSQFVPQNFFSVPRSKGPRPVTGDVDVRAHETTPGPDRDERHSYVPAGETSSRLRPVPCETKTRCPGPTSSKRKRDIERWTRPTGQRPRSMGM